MILRPEDVVRKKFNHARFRGGYAVEEVDGFLEEVLSELRRLNALVDEQQAELNQRPVGGAVTAGSFNLVAEQEQLEHVRKERDALVAEMEDADRRIAEAREAAELAEEAKNSSLEEIRARFDDDLVRLEERVSTARANALVVEDDSRKRAEAAEDRALAAERNAQQLRLRLSKISGEVRAAAAEHLGSDVVEGLIPFADGLEEDPVAQASAVAMLAERIRRDHLSAGERQAKLIVGDAERERDRIINEGRSRFDEAETEAASLLAVALAEGQEVKDAAQVSSQLLLAEAERQQEKLQEDSRRECEERVRMADAAAAKLVEDARLERDALLSELATRRDGLEKRILELDESVRGYRQRVRGLVQDQLSAIDRSDWDR